MFSLSSKFYQICVKIYQLLLLNLLILAFSLPIVTIGAAISAGIKINLNEIELNIGQTYFNYFKENFRKTIPIFIFNCFSLMFILSLNSINLNGSYFFHFIKLIFISFVISYNINIYVLEIIFNKHPLFHLFQVTFLFTLKTFFKTLLFPLMATGLFYASISILNYISLLFVFSLPLAVYLFLIKKETEELEELVKEKEIEIII